MLLRSNRLTLLSCRAFIKQQGRFIAVGVLAYLLWPWLQLAPWQYQLWLKSTASQLQALQPTVEFVERYGATALPALVARVELNQLSAKVAALEANYAEFSAQSRDEGWAEASEFLIQHIATSQPTPLTLSRIECRNTLCQLDIQLGKAGLDGRNRQRILQLAATLKAADLEYQQLDVTPSAVVLQLKSTKAYLLPWWRRWQVDASEQARWLEDIRRWLSPVAPPAQ